MIVDKINFIKYPIKIPLYSESLTSHPSREYDSRPDKTKESDFL